MACQIEQDFQALEVLHAITLPCKSLLGTTTSGFKWIPSVEDPERYLMTNDVLKIVQLYYTHHPVSERLRIALMSYQGFYGTGTIEFCTVLHYFTEFILELQTQGYGKLELLLVLKKIEHQFSIVCTSLSRSITAIIDPCDPNAFMQRCGEKLSGSRNESTEDLPMTLKMAIEAATFFGFQSSINHEEPVMSRCWNRSQVVVRTCISSQLQSFVKSGLLLPLRDEHTSFRMRKKQTSFESVVLFQGNLEAKDISELESVHSFDLLLCSGSIDDQIWDTLVHRYDICCLSGVSTTYLHELHKHLELPYISHVQELRYLSKCTHSRLSNCAWLDVSTSSFLFIPMTSMLSVVLVHSSQMNAHLVRHDFWSYVSRFQNISRHRDQLIIPGKCTWIYAMLLQIQDWDLSLEIQDRLGRTFRSILQCYWHNQGADEATSCSAIDSRLEELQNEPNGRPSAASKFYHAIDDFASAQALGKHVCGMLRHLVACDTLVINLPRPTMP